MFCGMVACTHSPPYLLPTTGGKLQIGIEKNNFVLSRRYEKREKKAQTRMINNAFNEFRNCAKIECNSWGEKSQNLHIFCFSVALQISWVLRAWLAVR